MNKNATIEIGNLAPFQREVRFAIKAYIDELFKRSNIKSSTVEDYINSQDNVHGVIDKEIELSLTQRNEKRAADELARIDKIASEEERKRAEEEWQKKQRQSRDKQNKALPAKLPTSFPTHHNININALYALLRCKELSNPKGTRNHDNSLSQRGNTPEQDDMADAALHILGAVADTDIPPSLKYFEGVHHSELLDLVKSHPTVVAEHFLNHITPDILQSEDAKHIHLMDSKNISKIFATVDEPRLLIQANPVSLGKAIQSAQNYGELKSRTVEWYEAALITSIEGRRELDRKTEANRQAPVPVVSGTLDIIGRDNVRVNLIP